MDQCLGRQRLGFYQGQHAAAVLFDFAAAFPVEIEFIAQTRGGGDPPLPNQVLGRMRRVAYECLEFGEDAHRR